MREVKLFFKTIHFTKEESKKLATILITALIAGLFAHGFMFANKFSFHDDALLFGIGQSIASGRWMLDWLGNLLSQYLFNSAHYSTPWFNGILSLVLLGLISYEIVDLLQINKWVICITLTTLIVVFPCITGTFGFMFTAPYYFFGTLLTSTGVWMFSRWNNIIGYLLSCLFLACGTGVYQANIPVGISLIFLYTIKRTVDNDGNWKEYFVNGFISISLCISFFAIYLLINDFVLSRSGLELTDYSGISGFADATINDYLQRIYIAYREFIYPTNNVQRNMFPLSINRIYRYFLIALVTVFLVFFIQTYKHNKRMFFQLMVYIPLLPLVCNFIYVMADITSIHSLMMFCQLTPFILLCYLLECIKDCQIVSSGLVTISVSLLLILNILYIRYDNICYLKANLMQSEAISYFNILISRIQQAEGYEAGMGVRYINEFSKNEAECNGFKEFDNICTNPYDGNSLINDWSWQFFMEDWCGFTNFGSFGYLSEDWVEVKEMPHYPDDGSIKVINGVVIVKF